MPSFNIATAEGEKEKANKSKEFFREKGRQKIQEKRGQAPFCMHVTDPLLHASLLSNSPRKSCLRSQKRVFKKGQNIF